MLCQRKNLKATYCQITCRILTFQCKIICWNQPIYGSLTVVQRNFGNLICLLTHQWAKIHLFRIIFFRYSTSTREINHQECFQEWCFYFLKEKSFCLDWIRCYIHNSLSDDILSNKRPCTLCPSWKWVLSGCFKSLKLLGPILYTI